MFIQSEMLNVETWIWHHRGKTSNCWSRETSFNHKLRKFTHFTGTWAETPLPLLSKAKHLSLCVLLGKNHLAFTSSGEARDGSDHLKLESLSETLEKNPNSEMRGMDWLLWDSGEGVWSGGLSCASKGWLWAKKQVASRKSLCSLFWPWLFTC